MDKSEKKPTRKYNYTKKTGRPSKINNIKASDVAYNLVNTGHTLEETAKILNVGISSIYRWIDADKKFREAIKNGRKNAVIRMENSLYHRGLGYSHPEEKIFQYEGTVIRANTIHHYPPDTAAAFIWLKNVNPAHWRDKTEVESKAITQIDHTVTLKFDQMSEPELLDFIFKRRTANQASRN